MNLWARVGDGAKVRLFCLPHAGSGAAGFFRWKRMFPEVEVSPIQLPGRDMRMAEAALNDAVALVDAMHAALRAELNKPYAIFGHSMGALLAALWAERIQQDDRPMPRALFLSARGVPVEGDLFADVNEISDEVLLERLDRRFGGDTASAILQDAGLREIYMPMLRADLQVVDSVKPSLFPKPLRTDVHVLRGREDHATAEADAEAWRSYAGGGFSHRVLPGGHFFHFGDSEAAVLSLLREAPTPSR